MPLFAGVGDGIRHCCRLPWVSSAYRVMAPEEWRGPVGAGPLAVGGPGSSLPLRAAARRPRLPGGSVEWACQAVLSKHQLADCKTGPAQDVRRSPLDMKTPVLFVMQSELPAGATRSHGGLPGKKIEEAENSLVVVGS